MAALHVLYGQILIGLSLLIALLTALLSRRPALSRGLRQALAGLLDLEILIGVALAFLIPLPVPWSRFFWHPLIMVAAVVAAHLAARAQGSRASWLSFSTLILLVIGYQAARLSLA
jgi:hypothetical protein